MSELNTTPDYVYEEVQKYKTLVSSFENGYEQRRNKWASGLKAFILDYRFRTKTEFETIRDLFISKKGSYDTLTWTNPNDSVEYTVRFDADSISFKNKAFELYDFSFKLLQVKA